MGNLKKDHSYLYKRVKLKGIVHLALGLVLIFLPSAVPTTSERGDVSATVTSLLTVFGFVYLAIGVAIAIGLYKSKQNYKLLRKVMTVSAIYNTVWSLLILSILVDKPNRSTAYIAVIYWYMTYNIWYVRNDPGWAAIEIIKRISDDHSDTRPVK